MKSKTYPFRMAHNTNRFAKSEFLNKSRKQETEQIALYFLSFGVLSTEGRKQFPLLCLQSRLIQCNGEISNATNIYHHTTTGCFIKSLNKNNAWITYCLEGALSMRCNIPLRVQTALALRYLLLCPHHGKKHGSLAKEASLNT